MVCEEFCNQAKSFSDMDELNSTFNFEKSVKKYGKINKGRYMNIMFNMLTSDASKNSFLFLQNLLLILLLHEIYRRGVFVLSLG